MKYLSTYNLFESANNDDMIEIGDDIKEILRDISDEGDLYVVYNYYTEDLLLNIDPLELDDDVPAPKYVGRYDIMVSKFDVSDPEQVEYFSDKEVWFKWNRIDGTIKRIRSLLDQYNYRVEWDVEIDGNETCLSVSNLIDRDPPADTFTVKIRLYKS